MKAVSEIVGRGELEGGGVTAVYRALRSLLCATCGAGIIDGTLFTRRKVKGIGVSIMPQCRKCAPFVMEAGGKKPSELIRTLLAAPPERDAPEGPSAAPLKNLDEEVARRLGPALRRGRRGRDTGK